MAKQSAGQKRREKDLKRRKKQQLLRRKNQLKHPLSRADETKLSSVLLEYAAPLLEAMVDDSADLVDVKDGVETAIDLAVICWNIASYPEEILSDIKDEMIRDIIDQKVNHTGNKELFFGLLNVMINGKRDFFSEDPRFVMEYEIMWSGDEYGLRVFSSTIPPEIFDEVSEKSFKEIKSELFERYEF